MSQLFNDVSGKTNVLVPSLHAAISEKHYALHQAALEWSLADTIIIRGPEDFKSKINWHDKLKPYEHQVENLISFASRVPCTLLADDVGLGKTISAGLVISELMARGKVERVLVLASRILLPQWVEELDNKFGIEAVCDSGSKVDPYLNGTVPVVVTTYDTAKVRFEQIESCGFQMLILDEAHHIRNLYGSQKPPVKAQAIRNALEQRIFKYVLMLTATPIQNRLWDLYSLIDCLAVAKGHDNPFGSPEQFKHYYIADSAQKARELNPQNADQFRFIVRSYMKRTRRKTVGLLFPEREVKKFCVDQTDIESKLKDVVASIIKTLNPLLQSSLSRAMMSSPQALAKQLKNMARNRPEIDEIASFVKEIADMQPQTAKLKGLMQLCNEQRAKNPLNWRVVVFTIRKETQRAICLSLDNAGMMDQYGTIQGGDPFQNKETIKKFCANPPQFHVIVSTDAGAEGINLQAGNVVVNYDLPWNPMIVEQRIGRVQRLASKFKKVIVINLVVTNSIEEHVVSRLMEKLQVISHTVGDIESIIEATSKNNNERKSESSESSFESQIRKLVVESLLKQDTGEAIRKVEESVIRAHERLRENEKELDRTLGDPDESNDCSPQIPKLKRQNPSILFNEFVKQAMKLEGAQLEKQTDNIFLVRMQGRHPERITFDKETARNYAANSRFMGSPPELYQPSSPVFERLVQRWVNSSAGHILSLEALEDDLVKQMSHAWCDTIKGAKLQKSRMIESKLIFDGEITCKTRVGNGVDSYEKLIHMQPSTPNDYSIPMALQECATPIQGEINLPDLSLDIECHIRRAVDSDQDIGKFCQFYRERLAVDRQKTGDDPMRLKRVEDDLAPVVSSELAGMRGLCYHHARIEVQFTIDEKGDYVAIIEGIPAAGKIEYEPPRRRCATTNRLVPEDCLLSCDVTGTLVMSHLLVISDETGRRGLYSRSVRCPETGKTVFDDEMRTSAITGKQALASMFRKSPVSNRLGLPEDFILCQITGNEVLRDELVQSEISGKFFRCDQKIQSTVSQTSGHQSEFVTCEYSGKPILPSEARISDVTGKLARKDKLVTSEAPSKRHGWPSEIVTCCITNKNLLKDEVDISTVSSKCTEKGLMVPSAKSGKLALPEELILCEVTGAKVLPCECQKCVASGMWVIRDRLVQSAVSGNFVRDDLAVWSLMSKKPCAPGEATTCIWLAGPILPQEVGICNLTDLQIAKSQLNHAGEFSVLRELLDGRRAGTEDTEIRKWIQFNCKDYFKQTCSAYSIASPTGKVIVVLCEIKPTLLVRLMGNPRHWWAGMIIQNGLQKQILGQTVKGYFHNGWIPIS